MDAELRFGHIVSIYYEIKDVKMPSQITAIQTWFPNLIVIVDPSDGKSKISAYYEDRAYVIHAVKYKDTLYTGGSSGRIAQILGRLMGTASSNQEKERKTATLIQKHVADLFIKDMTLTPRLKENTRALLDCLNETQINILHQKLITLIFGLADKRKRQDDYEQKTELFAMDDESFDGVIYNAAYQLALNTYDGLCHAYLWLLAGGLLRNEIGRVVRVYDSAFIAVNRQLSENDELADKLYYLFFPEDYEYTFDGDKEDMQNRFPDVEWYCDRCDAHLNEQAGFDDHLPEWTCMHCGFVNKLDISEIYDNNEDWQNHRPIDAQKFIETINKRKKEMNNIS